MNTTQVSVDLAKALFQVAVSHTPGRVHRERRLSKAAFQRFFAWPSTCRPPGTS